MQFDLIALQAVKSISQRNLAIHWQTLHARHGLPRFDAFSPGNRAHDPRQLLLWAIDEADGNRSYRPLYGGAYVAEVYGPNLRQELSEPLRVIFKAGMDTCTTTANITYMQFATSDAAGHHVTCERLLLPFGRGDSNVTHVLASLQLVSVDGTFERRTIMQHFERQVEVTLCGRILPAAGAAAPVAAQIRGRARKPVRVA
jgi:hypothetical protein